MLSKSMHPRVEVNISGNIAANQKEVKRGGDGGCEWWKWGREGAAETRERESIQRVLYIIQQLTVHIIFVTEGGRGEEG